MTLNTSDKDQIAHRREQVARLRLHGLTQREIVNTLSTQLSIDVSLATVNGDIKALQAQWRQSANRSTAQHKARVFMEIQEVKRQAWQEGELGNILRALKQECDLLGLDAPRQVDIVLLRNKAQEIADKLGIPVADVLAQAERVAAAVLQGAEL